MSTTLMLALNSEEARNWQNEWCATNIVNVESGNKPFGTVVMRNGDQYLWRAFTMSYPAGLLGMRVNAVYISDSLRGAYEEDDELRALLQVMVR